MQEKQRNSFSLIVASLKMAVATFSSRILGLVREQVMAATFGATGITDAFTIAYRVPNMLRDLFAEGAFSSAFVPVFTEVRLKDEKAARRLLWSLFILLAIITSIISLFIIIFAPEVIEFVTNDKFTANEERLLITTQLVRVMAPFLTLVSLAALFMGALNSLKVFFVPSLAPVFFNIMMILSMLFLPPVVEKAGYHPIFSLGIGVVTGGLLQMLIQVPLIIKKNYGPIGPIELFNKSTKKVLNRLGIGTFGIAANQVNILVTTVLATGTQLGAISWLTYAFRLFQFPVGILSVSIAGSNLVHFSDCWKAGDREGAISILKSSYLFSLFTITPAFCLLYALSEETVQLVFERGAFSITDTQQSALALRAYLVGLPFYGLYKIFAPTFFTLDKPKVPVFISMFTVVMNIIFCLIFVPRYGFHFLALGTSLSMILNCVLQSFFLRKELSLSLSFFFNLHFLKFLLAGAICFYVTWHFKALGVKPVTGYLSEIVGYGLSLGLGALSYILCLYILGEGHHLKRILRKNK